MAQSLVDRVKSVGRKAVLVAALVSVPATITGCYTQMGTREERQEATESPLPPLLDSPIDTDGVVQYSETRYADAGGGVMLEPAGFYPRSGARLSLSFGWHGGLSPYWDSDGDGVPDAEDPWPFTYGPYVRTPFGDEYVAQPYFFGSPWIGHYHTPWNLWLFENPRHHTPYFGFHDYNHRPHLTPLLPHGWRDYGTPRDFGRSRTDGRGRVVVPPTVTPPPATRTPIMPRGPGMDRGREGERRNPQTERGREGRRDAERQPQEVRPRTDIRIPEEGRRRSEIRTLRPDNMPAYNPRTPSNMPIYRPPPAARGDRGVVRTPTYETPRNSGQRQSQPPQQRQQPQNRGGDQNRGSGGDRGGHRR